MVKALDAVGEPIRGERRINEQQADIVRRIFREFANGSSPRAIARRLNDDGIPGPRDKRWSDNTLRGRAARGTGLLNNELYVGRLVWNRQRRALNPETRRKVSRINPPEEWVVANVLHLRVLDDDLWKAAKDRQDESAKVYAAAIADVRHAHANPMNATHRPRHLLSGLLQCGVFGGAYGKRGQDRYACSNHARTDGCTNRRGLRRIVLEERVLAGLKHRLMAPEAATKAIRAYAEETNRLNRERRASGAGNRKEPAEVEKEIAAMIAAIEDGGSVRGMSDRLRELEARPDALAERLAAALADLPDIHPNMAGIYRRNVARLADVLKHPEDRDEAATAIRGFIERIVLSPGEKWGEVHATLRGDLGKIPEWTATGVGKNQGGTSPPGLSVSAETRTRFGRPLQSSSDTGLHPQEEQHGGRGSGLCRRPGGWRTGQQRAHPRHVRPATSLASRKVGTGVDQWTGELVARSLWKLPFLAV